MVVFDDMDVTEKLKIFDKGVNINTEYKSYEDFLTLRFGDILIPRINLSEPLKLECHQFLKCIEDGKEPISNGASGLQVVRILEAAQKSLEKGGMPVKV
jgi:predicted dehydrogenase